jgi:uncharacterized protein involved in response to NO
MFTRNATGVDSIRSIPLLDVLTIVGMSALVLLDVLAPDGPAAIAASGAVGVLASARAIHWGTRHTARHPLLWVLHLGYAWIPVGFLLRALAGIDLAIPRSLATHALTVGAIASICLGMMARVSLGHTGRSLTPAKSMTWAFGAMAAAGFARVLLPLFAPSLYFPSLVIAGALWSVAFILYLVVYVPVLTSPRVDGKMG